MGKKGGGDSDVDTIIVGFVLATAFDLVTTGQMPPLITSLMSGDTSILMNPMGWFGFLSGIGAPAAPAATVPVTPGTPAIPAPTAAGAPTGGGDISPGECPSGGETCVKDNLGRYDCSNVTADTYEATWCGDFSGDDLTIKLYGPEHHSDGDCCWCVVHVKPDGTMTPGGEGPHPSSNCEHPPGKNVGKGTCYKAVMRPGPIQEGYALVGGVWKQAFSYKGPCGCSKTATTKTGNQVTFRCDGSFNTKCATVKPLGGGGGAAPAAATPPATTEAPKADEKKAEKAKAEFANVVFGKNRYLVYT